MKIHKSSLFLIACLAGASPMGHADTAVSQTNVQVEASYGRTTYATGYFFFDNLDALAGHVALQVPIGGWLGMSLDGVIGQVRSDSFYDYDYDYDYDYYQYMASLFARSPEIGLLGVGVGGTKIKLNSFFGDTSSTDYQAIAAAYLGPVTLAMTHIYSDNKDTADTNKDTWADLTWYVIPNLLLTVSAGFMDTEDNYSLALEHQIGKTGFSYGLNYAWNNAIDVKSYFLVLSYRFGASKSLKDRYRHDLYSAH